MPTLYLTEDHALVRRDTEDCLLVQVPEQRGEGGTVLAIAYKKRIPLVKVQDVVVMGEVTMTASALYCFNYLRVSQIAIKIEGNFYGDPPQN